MSPKKYQTAEEAHQAKLEKMKKWREAHPNYAKEWRLKKKQQMEQQKQQLQQEQQEIEESNNLLESTDSDPKPKPKAKAKRESKKPKVKQSQIEEIQAENLQNEE